MMNSSSSSPCNGDGPPPSAAILRVLLDGEKTEKLVQSIISKCASFFKALQILEDTYFKSILNMWSNKVSQQIREYVASIDILAPFDWSELDKIIENSINETIPHYEQKFTDKMISFMNSLNPFVFNELKRNIQSKSTQDLQPGKHEEEEEKDEETEDDESDTGSITADYFWNLDSEASKTLSDPQRSSSNHLCIESNHSIQPSTSKGLSCDNDLRVPNLFYQPKSVEPAEQDKVSETDPKDNVEADPAIEAETRDDQLVVENGINNEDGDHNSDGEMLVGSMISNNHLDVGSKASDDEMFDAQENLDCSNDKSTSTGKINDLNNSASIDLPAIEDMKPSADSVEDPEQEPSTSASSSTKENKKTKETESEAKQSTAIDDVLSSVDQLLRSPRHQPTTSIVPADSDSDSDIPTSTKSKKKKKKKKVDDEDDLSDDVSLDLEGYQVANDDEDSDEAPIRVRKTRKAYNIDSDDSPGGTKRKIDQVDSAVESESHSSLRRNNSPDNEERENKSDKTETKRKKKRKRVKYDSTPEESSQSEYKNSHESESDEESARTKFRKNIRRIRGKDKLQKGTLHAERAEKEKRKRLQNKEKVVQELLEESPAVKELVLDIDAHTKEVLVKVDEKFCQRLKSHQLDGIKFMYNCTIESIARLEHGDKGSGCILAHSMGLGKTFQVVTFLLTIFNHPRLEQHLKRVLILVPKNVVNNWVDEIVSWSSKCEVDECLNIYNLDEQTPKRREELCHEWFQSGGILLVTTTTFKNLIEGKKKKTNREKAGLVELKKTLLDPGPDIVVFDEGHMMKNTASKVHEAVSQVSTLRRIILTGTPLQNNLMEYYVMVNFVKPDLLGNKKEFANRFENPIKNGQQIDSTEYDVKLMKKRVHVLHSLLAGFVHRRDYNVLVPFLPKKHEYVLAIKLHEVQVKLYQNYLENCVTNGDRLQNRLFKDYTQLSYIWNHPHLLKSDSNGDSGSDRDNDSAGSLQDFVVYDHDTSEESNSNGEVNQGATEEPPTLNPNAAWFEQHLPADSFQIELSSKFVLLFEIIKKCEAIGDKLLVFSQSVKTLKLILRFLKQKGWLLNRDFFFIDGSVSCTNRSFLIKHINNLTDTRARLMLLSTKACGLGINLTGANRCIIFDASWNPSNDLQAIYRIFRYGQKKQVFIYRFTAFGSMESKVYHRQIIKQSLSHRVVDEQQIQRHFGSADLNELYELKLPKQGDTEVLNVPSDPLLADLIIENKEQQLIVSFHEHDSLLENKPEEGLSDEERKQAWLEYESSKARERLPQPSTSQTEMPSYDMLLQAQLNSLQSAQTFYNNQQLNQAGPAAPSDAYRDYYLQHAANNMHSTRAQGFGHNETALVKLLEAQLKAKNSSLAKFVSFKSMSYEDAVLEARLQYNKNSFNEGSLQTYCYKYLNVWESRLYEIINLATKLSAGGSHVVQDLLAAYQNLRDFRKKAKEDLANDPASHVSNGEIPVIDLVDSD